MAAVTLKEDKMYGSLFVLFKRYIENAYDYSTWIKLTEQVGITGSSFQKQEMYPTQDLLTLVQATSHLTNISSYQVLEQYGEFLVPDLLLVYRQYVQSGAPMSCS